MFRVVDNNANVKIEAEEDGDVDEFQLTQGSNELDEEKESMPSSLESIPVYDLHTDGSHLLAHNREAASDPNKGGSESGDETSSLPSLISISAYAIHTDGCQLLAHKLEAASVPNQGSNESEDGTSPLPCLISTSVCAIHTDFDRGLAYNPGATSIPSNGSCESEDDTSYKLGAASIPSNGSCESEDDTSSMSELSVLRSMDDLELRMLGFFRRKETAKGNTSTEQKNGLMKEELWLGNFRSWPQVPGKVQHYEPHHDP